MKALVEVSYKVLIGSCSSVLFACVFDIINQSSLSNMCAAALHLAEHGVPQVLILMSVKRRKHNAKKLHSSIRFVTLCLTHVQFITANLSSKYLTLPTLIYNAVQQYLYSYRVESKEHTVRATEVILCRVVVIHLCKHQKGCNYSFSLQINAPIILLVDRIIACSIKWQQMVKKRHK